MKRLVLYSDQVTGISDEIDKALIKMLDKEKPRIAYIPSRADLSRKYYNQKLDYYKRLGIDNLMYFDIDVEYDPARVDELVACDAIHLSGGDTAYFLNSIRKRAFQDILINYANNGGILVGISAGSILMSDCIDVISVLHDGEPYIENSESLHLNSFEFVPHWERNCIYLDELKKYSEQKNITLYACRDSDGIIVCEDNINFIGRVIEITNGNVKCNEL